MIFYILKTFLSLKIILFQFLTCVENYFRKVKSWIGDLQYRSFKTSFVNIVHECSETFILKVQVYDDRFFVRTLLVNC